MLRFFLALLLTGTALATAAGTGQTANGPAGKVRKVLPHLLDSAGRHAVSPSLFDRDAYQAYLRDHPDRVGGLRFDVRWKTVRAEAGSLTVRVELLGTVEGKSRRTATLEVSPDRTRGWTSLRLEGDAYAEFGSVTAWRVTLWCEDEMLDEYKSFLW